MRHKTALITLTVVIALLGCQRLLPAATPEPVSSRPARPAKPTRPVQPAGRSRETVLSQSSVPAAVPDSRFALGINEAVAVPARLAQTMPVDQQSIELVDDATAAASVGARFVRGHTGNYPTLSQMDLGRSPDALKRGDAWVAAVQGAGLEPLLMVSPWPGNDTAKFTQRYLPTDMAAYSAYVTRVVERYDGDGVDDMPGLKAPVRYWEVDNEPDLKNSTIARGATETYDPTLFCTPDEYAQVFLASAKAIKAAFPEARVLNGGLYRPHSEQGSSWFREFTAVPGVLDAIDIVSAHTYHDDLDGERLAIGVRNERFYTPSKPLWVTETSLGTNDSITEADQARMVVTFVVRSALEGADKVFWHTLSDPPAQAGGRTMPMSGHSLFRTDEQRQRTIKPAGEVYTHLAAFLLEHDLNGCVVDAAGAVKLRDGTVLLYEGSRDVPRRGVDLRTGKALAAGATATAPAWVE